MTDESRKRWRKRGIYAAIAFVVWLFVTIDDWSRDFTTNEATLSSTDVPCANVRGECCLRDGLAGRSVEEVAAGVKMAARRIPTMRFTQEMSDGTKTLLHFERQGRLLRFKSDITVEIVPGRGRPSIEAESSSRVGFGDLGQNPRNLSLMMMELAAVLDCGSSRQPALEPPAQLR